jgi:hypothetical protein
MAKRAAEDEESGPTPLKKGDRPIKPEQDKDNEVGDFEDEFEDEFESEDEIFEAGVDGRPDAEREAEESRGTWLKRVALCDLRLQLNIYDLTDWLQMQWMLTSRPSFPGATNFKLENR